MDISIMRDVLHRGLSIGSLVLMVPFLGAAFGAARVHADQITVDGVTWKDVLIYESSTMYYIKVPAEGLIFNTPLDSVSASDVIIERDPYYRDELRRQYDEATSGKRRPSGRSSGDSAFNVREGRSGGGEPGVVEPPTNDVEVGGQDPMAMLTGMLKNMGFSISEDGGDTVAESSDGVTTIRVKGGSLDNGIGVTLTVPEAQLPKLEKSLTTMSVFFGMTSPWVSGWLQQEVVPLLSTGGSAEKTEAPTAIKAEVVKADGKVTLTIDATPAS